MNLKKCQLKNNCGVATVEACIVIPVFLFFFLSIASIIMIFFAETHIHQSLAETCNELSVNCFYEDCANQNIQDREETKNNGVDIAFEYLRLNKAFAQYLGNDFFVERVVRNGKKGIFLTVKNDEKNKKIFYGQAEYTVNLYVPMIGTFVMERQLSIKQKRFVGYTYGEEAVEEYVYVTPYESVYHTNRGCTHLSLSVQSMNASQTDNYKMCAFCKKSENNSSLIYVAKTSDICHTNKNCSGLKRTVTRVKKSTIGGLAPCSRCGK